MSGYGAWLASAFAGSLVAAALGWALARRYAPTSAFARTLDTIDRIPGFVWSMVGAAAFLLPVLIYWLSARSHGNALAGFLPWSDAAGYFTCSESYLLGFDTGGGCGRRPFFFAFFAVLLWLTGNQLQFALLLQAFFVGCAVVLFARAFTRHLDRPGLIALYSVLFLFAAALCSGLVMTENAGLLLGLLAVAILWNSPDVLRLSSFLLGLVLMAAAQNSRAGAMLVLPALIGWSVFHCDGSWRRRCAFALAGVAAVIAGMALASAPSLIVNGSLGGAQANFSYSLYGLVSGGKKWVHVFEARPDIFAAGGSEGEVAWRIYKAALESVLTRPDLALIGYLKGLGEYFEDLFRFVGILKPLRHIVFLPLWLLGIWSAARRWREPRLALVLWMQLGIILSSPFISFDGINRVYAATMGVDAAFVGLGMAWLSDHLMNRPDSPSLRVADGRSGVATLETVAASFLLVPLVFLGIMRSVATPATYPAPACGGTLEAVVVRPERSTLVLPIVGAGDESVFPLRVRADHFAARMDKSVSNAFELRHKPGTALIWGLRLDRDHFGQTLRFAWNGELPPAGQVVMFCVKRPERGSTRNIGIATSVHLDIPSR